MSARRRGMGRGLEAILSVSSEDRPPSGEELREIPIDLITANPRQPRRRFDEDALAALAGSLGERGVLQPVLVRPTPAGVYELIAGERRWRAARLAGLEAIPALVRPHDDALALEVALIENMAREDLNPIEEARAVAALVEELGLTREQVGKRVGRSRVAVSNLLRLLDLPDEALALIERGTLSEGHGRALLLAKDHTDRRRLARSAAAEGWTVRVVEQRARRSSSGAGSGEEGSLGARSSGAGARGNGGPPGARDDAPGAGVLDRGGRGGDGGRRGAKKRGQAGGKVHPDQEAAAAEVSEALSRALRADVHVEPAADGGYRAELSFATREEAFALAEGLHARRTGR
jgi:ParB family chromosome partitioning protein